MAYFKISEAQDLNDLMDIVDDKRRKASIDYEKPEEVADLQKWQSILQRF